MLNSFKSKTVWFGLLLGAATWLQGSLNNLGLTPSELSLWGPIVGALVIILRAVTTVPLSQK